MLTQHPNHVYPFNITAIPIKAGKNRINRYIIKNLKMLDSIIYSPVFCCRYLWIFSVAFSLDTCLVLGIGVNKLPEKLLS